MKSSTTAVNDPDEGCGDGAAPVSAPAAVGEPISARQAAKLVGVHERTIRRAISSGDLPATSSGGAYQITPDDLVLLYPERFELDRSPGSANSLPTPLSDLIGREDTVARVAALVRRPAVRLVTLTGPGGVGKTRLALAAASMLSSEYADGTYFVDLASIFDESLVSGAIARAIGLRPVGTRSPADQVIAFLSNRQVLLVLDNMEQLIAAAPWVAEVLSVSPGVDILVTSRRPLHISGERAFPVQPLTLPVGENAHWVGAVLGSEAGQLFAARSEEVDPAFTVTEETAQAIAEICTRLDGLPLAIEFAAARTNVLPPQAIRARLHDVLSFLTDGASDLPARQQTLRGTIAWSYDLLSPEGQALFRRLSVFASDFSLQAAEAVNRGVDHPSFKPEETQPLHIATPQLLDLVSSLVDHNLVRLDRTLDNEPRYRLLESVREFGKERLKAAGESEAARLAHAGHFLSVAETCEHSANRPGVERVLARLDADHFDLRAALTWLDENGEVEYFVRTAGALAWFWQAHGYLHEGRERLQQATELSKCFSNQPRAKALVGLGIVTIFLGDHVLADDLLRDGIALLRDGGEDWQLATALIWQGALYNYREDFDRARLVTEEGRAIAETLDDAVLAATLSGRALCNLAVTEHELDNLERARSLNQEAFDRHRSVGYARGSFHALRNLGDISRDQGDAGGALADYCDALIEAEKFGDVQVITDALRGLGVVAVRCGEPIRAACLFGAAEAHQELVGLPIMATADRDAHDNAVHKARDQLGEDQFSDAWAEGSKLTTKAAIFEAMALNPPKPSAKSLDDAPIRLTDRQIEVLRGLSRRESNREIADALFISPRTVGWHVSQILGELGVSSRREAAAEAHRLGIT